MVDGGNGSQSRDVPEVRRDGFRSIAGWAGIVGPVLFTVTFMAQELVRREEYNPLAETVSALEAGPNGWVQQVNFVVFGVLTGLFALGLHRGIRRRGRAQVAGPALLLVSAVGLLLAAVFPLRENAQGATYDPGGHVVAGTTFFLASALALVVLSRRLQRDEAWSDVAAYTLACGVLALVAFVAMGALVMPDDAPLHEWAGLAQRLVILLVIFPCRVVLAIRLVAPARGRRPDVVAPAVITQPGG
jgi:hypothetical membrane protein